MERATLYLETTIPSYLTARISQNLIVAAHQVITIEWWRYEAKNYDIFISQFVLDEVQAGDSEVAQKRLTLLHEIPLLEVTDEVLALTERIFETDLFPLKAIRDVSHIAVAAVHGIDFLLTWNCTHINHAKTKEKVRIICEREGWKIPVICSPEEIMEERDV